MASLDDLVKASRSKRVQVADLPDAPKLRPTIRSGGQYTVAVQQAGRNKLMDLADALSKVNPILKEYKGIADIELEDYKQELASLKPEELQGMLKKTEGEFDKMSRKGGFTEWLVSPVNEVRKRRALGRAAHDQFQLKMLDANSRLYKPNEGDDKLTTAQILEQEYDTFVSENPALQGQYAGEGFREAVNPTILALTQRFDQRKAEQSKSDTLLGNTSAIHRLAKRAPLDSELGYNIAMDEASKIWDDLNAFSPDKQLKVIESISTNLAREKGGERKAERFLLWAQSNLKVGNTSFAVMEDQVDRLESVISATAEASERLNEEERKDKMREKSAEFGILLNQLGRNGSVTLNPGEEPITTREALLERFQVDAEQDEDNIYTGEVSREFERVMASDLDPNQFIKNKIIKDSYSYNALYNNVSRQMLALGRSSAFKDLSTDPEGAGEFIKIERDLYNKLKAEADMELERIIASGEADNPAEATLSLNKFIDNKMVDFQKEAINDLEQVRKRQTEAEKAEKEYTQQIAVDPGEDPKQAATENTFFDESLTEMVEKSSKNVLLLAIKDIPLEERQKALEYNDKYFKKALTESAKVATGGYKKRKFKNYGVALKSGLKIVNPEKMRIKENRFGFDKSLVEVELNEHSAEEMRKARDQYFRMARIHGTFSDVQVLKSGITPEGIDGFDVENDINSASFVLMKADRLKAIKDVKTLEEVPDDVKEIADLIGESDDYLKFIRNQIRLQKALFDPNFDK